MEQKKPVAMTAYVYSEPTAPPPSLPPPYEPLKRWGDVRVNDYPSETIAPPLSLPPQYESLDSPVSEAVDEKRLSFEEWRKGVNDFASNNCFWESFFIWSHV